MLYIDCPYCGKRAHEEFSYIGDATKKRPDGAEKKVLRNILTHEILAAGRPADEIPLPEVETKP